MPAPPRRRELRVERVPRVETSPRTLALLALRAVWSVRAERTLGGAVLDERVELVEPVELVPLTAAPPSLWPQFEQ
jgi:hypothetical protein